MHDLLLGSQSQRRITFHDEWQQGGCTTRPADSSEVVTFFCCATADADILHFVQTVQIRGIDFEEDAAMFMWRPYD